MSEHIGDPRKGTCPACSKELEAEVDRLQEQLAEQDARGLGLASEVERLQKDLPYKESLADVMQENERLRKALNRAGDRLAQVQPGVTEPWAFDIVPKAEQEIAAALAEEQS